MPCVKREVKKVLDLGQRPDDASELHYRLTRLCVQYLNDRGESSATYLDIVGALESAKLEFYRRRVGLFEDTQCAQFGDPYFGDK
jgi:hypothetical protein